MILPRVLFIVILLYPCYGEAMEQINFLLSNEKNKLRMAVINNGDSGVLINKKFSLGPEGKRGNIELYFSSDDGEMHKLSAKINYGKVTEADLILLEPGKSFEKEISHSDLMEYYDLVPGIYTVTGIYKNNYLREMGAFIGKVESLPLTIKIGK